MIDEEGNNVGIISTREAREYAESKGLDLVEVAPDARPPVCRVMDYGKFMYEQTKKERAAKKTQKQVEIKGLRIRPDTDPYHVGFKVRQARGFLLKGNKVRVICQFRGRERNHPEIARSTMNAIAKQLADIATVEQSANFEGRNMTMILTPDPAAVEEAERAAQAAKAARAAESARTGRPVPEPVEEELEEDFDEMDEEFEDDDFEEDEDSDETGAEEADFEEDGSEEEDPIDA